MKKIYTVLACLSLFSCSSKTSYQTTIAPIDIFIDTVSTGYTKESFEKIKPNWIHIDWKPTESDTAIYSMNVDSVYAPQDRPVPFYQIEFINGKYHKIWQALED